MDRFLTEAEINILRTRVMKKMTAELDKELKRTNIMKIGDKLTVMVNFDITLDTALMFD